MTPRQAAKVLGCHVRHIKHLIVNHKMRADKITIPGKDRFRYSIPKREVLRYKRLKLSGSGWPRGKPRT